MLFNFRGKLFFKVAQHTSVLYDGSMKNHFENVISQKLDVAFG